MASWNWRVPRGIEVRIKCCDNCVKCLWEIHNYSIDILWSNVTHLWPGEIQPNPHEFWCRREINIAYIYIFIYLYIFHTSSHTSQKSRMGFGIKRRYDIHDPQERLQMSGPPKRAFEFLSFPSPALGDSTKGMASLPICGWFSHESLQLVQGFPNHGLPLSRFFGELRAASKSGWALTWRKNSNEEN